MMRAATGAQVPTLGGLLLDALRRSNALPVLRWKRFGVWHPVTGEIAAKRAEFLARGLRASGFSTGDTAMIFAGNCCEWVIADIAIVCAGGVSAGVDASSSAKDLLRMVNEQRAQVLFVEGEHRVQSALSIRHFCPSLRYIVRLREDWSAEATVDVLSLAELETRGSVQAVNLPSVSPDAPAVIIYSSGTTGPSRGSVLTHRAICAQVMRAVTGIGLRAGDERLALTPIHHVLERVVGIYAAVAANTIINFAESNDTAFADLAELQPSIVQAAPRIWRSLRSGILLTLKDSTPLQRGAYGLAMTIAGKAANAARPSLGLRLVRAAVDWLVLRPIRQRIGVDGARLCLSSGAAWHPEDVNWLRLLARETIDVYGQAETGGVVCLTRLSSANRRSAIALEGVETTLSENQEICLRMRGSPTDGWYRSGDIGVVAETGAIAVVGRMSDVPTESSRVRISSYEITQILKASNYIADAAVVLNAVGRSVALILLDFETVVRFAQDHAIPFTHFRSLCQTTEVRELIGQIVEDANRSVPSAAVEAFELIERYLNLGDPEIGPALTLRHYLLSQHRGRVEHTSSMNLQSAQ
jgi:long-chain acyl-CoA synthetase